MYNNITETSVPEEIKKEFQVTLDGQAFCSARGLARLCDVEHTSIVRGGAPASEKLAQFLADKGFEGGVLVTENGIPEKIATLIIEYYAFESGRYCTDMARHVYRCFAAIGFRTWAQKVTGWQPVNQSTNQHSSRVLIAKQKIELAETAMEFWQKLGMFDERDRLMLKDYTQNAVYSIEQNYIESAKITQVTISNRVMELGYRADNSVLKKIGVACSREYKKLMGKSPVKHQQYVDGGVREVNSYTTEDLPMIDRIIQNFFGN